LDPRGEKFKSKGPRPRKIFFKFKSEIFEERDKKILGTGGKKMFFFFWSQMFFKLSKISNGTKYEKKFFIFVKREICLNFEKF